MGKGKIHNDEVMEVGTFSNILHNFIFQISKDLLSESQSVVFADMVRDIVRQLKLNPNQIPVPTASRRNVDKVTYRNSILC